jgi:outer membrane autotransporter protein
VIGPRDPTIFSAQDVAFAELNQAAVFDLLHRTLPDGGGNTFDNLSELGGPEGRAWIQVLGGFLDASRDGSTPSLRSTAGGVEGGADTAVGDGGRGRIGVAVGYESDGLSDSLGSSASQDIVRVSVYGSEMAGGIILSGALSYAHGWDHVDRASGAGFSYSSRGTDEFTGAVQLSAPLTTEAVIFTPAVGALFSSLRSGAFIERNSMSPAFAVVGLGSTMTTASPYVTLGLSHAFINPGGLVVTPDAMVGYRYDDAASGPRDPLAGGGAVFPDNQIGLSRGGALAGVSLTAHQGSWTGYIKYRATIASGWTDQSIGAGLRIAF